MVAWNDAGSATSSVARLFLINDAARAVRLVSANAAAGEAVDVALEVDAQGDENAIGFSIGFDTSFVAFVQATPGADAGSGTVNLNTNDAVRGSVGVLFALPAGVSLEPGTHEILRFGFQTTPGVGGVAVPLTLQDRPLAREVIDASAQPIPAVFGDGYLSIDAGLEADVMPLPLGNGAVTITDWVKVGRYAAGLDPAPFGSQYQRADCAPRSTQGSGTMTLSDWVQAGRYAAGLDDWVALGGPLGPIESLDAAPRIAVGLTRSPTKHNDLQPLSVDQREVRLVCGLFPAGQTGTFPLELHSLGGEAAVGCTLEFDPAILRFSGASLAPALAGSTLHLNTNDCTSGRLGVALALPIGQSLVAGPHELIRLGFSAVGSSTGTSEFRFTDAVVKREISDVLGNELEATYRSCIVRVLDGHAILLTPLVDLDGGKDFRLLVRNLDGSPIDLTRLEQIRVVYSETLLSPAAGWLELTNSLILSNGWGVFGPIPIETGAVGFFRTRE